MADTQIGFVTPFPETPKVETDWVSAIKVMEASLSGSDQNLRREIERAIVAMEAVGWDRLDDDQVRLALLVVKGLLLLGRQEDVDRISLHAVNAALNLRQIDLVCEALQTRASAMSAVNQVNAAIEAEAALLQAKTIESSPLGPAFSWNGAPLEFVIGSLHLVKEIKGDSALSRLRMVLAISTNMTQVYGGQRATGLASLESVLKDQMEGSNQVYLPYCLIMCINAMVTCGESNRSDELVKIFIKLGSVYIKNNGKVAKSGRLDGPLTEDRRKAIDDDYSFLHTQAILCSLPLDSSGLHPFRVGRLTGLLCQRRGLDADTCYFAELAGRLHDVGLIHVTHALPKDDAGYVAEHDDSLLEAHCAGGHETLMSSALPRAWLAADVALNHHERWDGSGYPQGKSGFAIPEISRMVAICDSFDEMVYGPHKGAQTSVAEALDALRDDLGKRFDPLFVASFVEMIEETGKNASELEALLCDGNEKIRLLAARQRPRSTHRPSLVSIVGLGRLRN